MLDSVSNCGWESYDCGVGAFVCRIWKLHYFSQGWKMNCLRVAAAQSFLAQSRIPCVASCLKELRGLESPD